MVRNKLKYNKPTFACFKDVQRTHKGRLDVSTLNSLKNKLYQTGLMENSMKLLTPDTGHLLPV